MADHYQRALAFATDPKWSKYVAPALLLADAVLCGLIIRTVACRTYPCSDIGVKMLMIAQIPKLTGSLICNKSSNMSPVSGITARSMARPGRSCIPLCICTYTEVCTPLPILDATLRWHKSTSPCST